MPKIVKLIAILLVLSITPTSLEAEEKENDGTTPQQEDSVYYFHRHLPEAEAYIIQKVSVESEETREATPGLKEKIMGLWDNDRFVFQELENEVPIALLEQSYKGFQQAGIFFQPLENGVKGLRFYEVPPGSQLILYYGIDDEGAKLKEDATVYLNIWIGNHKIRRLRIANRKGWKKEVIDLKELAFLRRGVVVTFEVSTDNAKGRRFSFLAEMHP